MSSRKRIKHHRLPQTSRVNDRIREYYSKFGQGRDLEKFMRLYSPSGTSSQRQSSCSQSQSRTTASSTSVSDDQMCLKRMFALDEKRPCEMSSAKSLPEIEVCLTETSDSEVVIPIESEIDDIGSLSKTKITSSSAQDICTPRKRIGSKCSHHQTPDSIAKSSNKRLEWDSLADVGYVKSMSTSNVSVLERNLLRGLFQDFSANSVSCEKTKSHVVRTHKKICKTDASIEQKSMETKFNTRPLASSTFVEKHSTRNVATSMTAEKRHEQYVQTTMPRSEFVSQETQVNLSSATPSAMGSLTTPTSFDYLSSASSHSTAVSDVAHKAANHDKSHPYIKGIAKLLAQKKVVTKQQTVPKAATEKKDAKLYSTLTEALDGDKENGNFLNSTQLDLGIRLIYSMIDAKSSNAKQKKKLVRDIVHRIASMGDFELDDSTDVKSTLNNTAQSHRHAHRRDSDGAKTCESLTYKSHQRLAGGMDSQKASNRTTNKKSLPQSKDDDPVTTVLGSLRTQTEPTPSQESLYSDERVIEIHHYQEPTHQKRIATRPVTVRRSQESTYPDEELLRIHNYRRFGAGEGNKSASANPPASRESVYSSEQLLRVHHYLTSPQPSTHIPPLVAPPLSQETIYPSEELLNVHRYQQSTQAKQRDSHSAVPVATRANAPRSEHPSSDHGLPRLPPVPRSKKPHSDSRETGFHNQDLGSSYHSDVGPTQTLENATTHPQSRESVYSREQLLRVHRYQSAVPVIDQIPLEVPIQSQESYYPSELLLQSYQYDRDLPTTSAAAAARAAARQIPIRHESRSTEHMMPSKPAQRTAADSGDVQIDNSHGSDKIESETAHAEAQRGRQISSSNSLRSSSSTSNDVITLKSRQKAPESSTDGDQQTLRSEEPHDENPQLSPMGDESTELSASATTAKCQEQAKTKAEREAQLHWIDSELQRLERLRSLLLHDDRQISLSECNSSNASPPQRLTSGQERESDVYDTVYSEDTAGNSDVQELEVSLEQSHENIMNIDRNTMKVIERKRVTTVAYDRSRSDGQRDPQYRTTKEVIKTRTQEINTAFPEPRSKIDTPPSSTDTTTSESGAFVRQRRREFLQHYRNKKFNAQASSSTHGDNKEGPGDQISSSVRNLYSLPHTNRRTACPENCCNPCCRHAFTFPMVPVTQKLKNQLSSDPCDRNLSSSILSSDVSVPMGAATSSHSTTTTHHYDDVAAVGLLAESVSHIHISCQTGSSLLRTQPIYETRKGSSRLTKPTSTEAGTGKPSCIQVRPKSFAYLITFDEHRPRQSATGEQSEERHDAEQRSVDDSVEQEQEQLINEDIKSQPSLQEYLKRSKPKFLTNAKKREAILTEMHARRRSRERELRDILENTSFSSIDRKLKRLPPPPTQQLRIFQTKEMKAMTRRKVSKLPEVLKKKEKDSEERLRRGNRILKKVFNQRMQNRVRKGQLSLNHSKTVI